MELLTVLVGLGLLGYAGFLSQKSLFAPPGAKQTAGWKVWVTSAVGTALVLGVVL